MLTKRELQDLLKLCEHLLLTRKNHNGDETIKSYSDYKYHLGVRDTLMIMLQVKKKTTKSDVPNEKLQKYGLENPLKRKKKD